MLARFLIPFCLDALALTILTCACGDGAGLALEMIEQRKKVRRVATTLPCLKDFAVLILGWVSVTVVAKSHLFCHREVQGRYVA